MPEADEVQSKICLKTAEGWTYIPFEDIELFLADQGLFTMNPFAKIGIRERNHVIETIGSFMLRIRDSIKRVRELRDQEVYDKLPEVLIQEVAGLRTKEISELIRSQNSRWPGAQELIFQNLSKK